MDESDKKKEMNVMRWAFRNTDYQMRMYNDFKGRNEVYWHTDQNKDAIFPQKTGTVIPCLFLI
jgi:hypothetical protein